MPNEILLNLKPWQRYLFSSFITFLAGAFIAILPELDELTLEALENGAAWGLAFAGIRAGFKAVIETFLVWYTGWRNMK